MEFLTLLRVVNTSAAAVVRGAANAILRRVPPGGPALQVGDRAPDFQLAAADGSLVRLSDYAGRQAVVLVWFPKAFSGGCTAQCVAIGARQPTLNQFEAVVLGATADSAEINRQFAAAMGLGFPILSDADGRVARAYGVMNASGMPSRWTFYIGLDGRIAAIDRRGRLGAHGADIEDTLARLGIARRRGATIAAPALTS